MSIRSKFINLLHHTQTEDDSNIFCDPSFSNTPRIMYKSPKFFHWHKIWGWWQFILPRILLIKGLHYYFPLFQKCIALFIPKPFLSPEINIEFSEIWKQCGVKECLNSFFFCIYYSWFVIFMYPNSNTNLHKLIPHKLPIRVHFGILGSSSSWNKFKIRVSPLEIFIIYHLRCINDFIKSFLPNWRDTIGWWHSTVIFVAFSDIFINFSHVFFDSTSFIFIFDYFVNFHVSPVIFKTFCC